LELRRLGSLSFASVDSLRESMSMRTRTLRPSSDHRTLMSERARNQPDEPHIYRESRRRRLLRDHYYTKPPRLVSSSVQPVTASSFFVAPYQRVHFRRGNIHILAWSKLFCVPRCRFDTSLEPNRAIFTHRRGIFRDNDILSTTAAVWF
jgi:hypothetical protein